MKDISIYFRPVSDGFIKSSPESLGTVVNIHTEDNFPELIEKGVAIIYCPEYRAVDEKKPIGSAAFRNSFYSLFPQHNWNCKIYDLGDVLPGEKVEDTYFAISNAMQELIKKDILPIVIGGSQDLTFAMYKAYEKLEQFVNLTTIDSKLDLGSPDQDVKYDKWLSHIVMHQPSYLFNYSNLGCQGHYVKPSTFDLFEQLYFDVKRLGFLNSNLSNSEPVLRNTDLLSLDLGSVRSSDLNSYPYEAPNGFFADQICQLSRYAGISDKLTSFGIFNVWGDDKHTVVHELIAQTIWYFIDGFNNRVGDFPQGSTKHYTKFRVFLEELDEEIMFYKSDLSARWWMNVPYPGKGNNKYVRHQMVPCTYLDYEDAMKNEIPDLWYKTYQKLS